MAEYLWYQVHVCVGYFCNFFLTCFPLLENGWGYMTPVVSFMESSFYRFKQQHF